MCVLQLMAIPCPAHNAVGLQCWRLAQLEACSVDALLSGRQVHCQNTALCNSGRFFDQNSWSSAQARHQQKGACCASLALLCIAPGRTSDACMLAKCWAFVHVLACAGGRCFAQPTGPCCSPNFAAIPMRCPQPIQPCCSPDFAAIPMRCPQPIQPCCSPDFAAIPMRYPQPIQPCSPNLQALSVRRCARLSDAALSAVIHCGKLQHLAVSNVHAFGPFSMAALAACCADTLEELDISFCRCGAFWAAQVSAGVEPWAAQGCCYRQDVHVHPPLMQSTSCSSGARARSVGGRPVKIQSTTHLCMSQSMGSP